MFDPRARPVILLASAPEDLGRLREELSPRYSHDYDLAEAADPEAALDILREAGAHHTPVAMLAVSTSLPGLDVLDFFHEAHAISPSARRIALLTRPGLRTDLARMQTAGADGRLDTWLTLPAGPRDEEFHGAMSEVLSEWAWTAQAITVEGVTIVDEAGSKYTARIVDFLQRMGIPHRRHLPDSDAGREVIAAAEPGAPLPLLRAWNGPILARPTLAEIGAVMLGHPRDLPAAYVADLVVVGSGPAGLAAAVYGASEGLETVVLEAEAVGGQAGTSSMIRNYLGFPRGISGMRLAQRARLQAGRFGARIYVGTPVVALERGDPHCLMLDDGTRVRSRAVVVATGATYRRLGVPAIEGYVGRGVHYGAATSVARDTYGREVYVVGGGNSAGQAAVHLSRFARRVTIVVRRGSLEETMSSYLIRELSGTDRIVVRPSTEVVDGGGDGHLEWLTLCDTRSGENERVAADALMLLLGAVPSAGWLPDSVDLDEDGFVLTGRDIPDVHWTDGRPPAWMGTRVPGVFAVGDVRSTSMKRVASASGEGAVVVPLVHAHLATD